MTINRSRFQRGSGVFVCLVCERRTRSTDADGYNADVEMCHECCELSGLQNSFWDNGGGFGGSGDEQTAGNLPTEWPDVWAVVDALIAQAIKKGSDEAKVRANVANMLSFHP